MATFNPEVGGVPAPNMPDQTGASRGIDTDRTFEYLFKGLGDAVGGVANAVDSSIKTSITNETMGIYDTVNKPYMDTVPAELAASGSAMQSLQTALEQGKISDTYYYGQLTALTKKMRSKYPGYEAFVDDTIQSVTGVRPANAYRNALMADFASEANAASDMEKFNRQWVKENEEFIYRVAPDYYTDPNKYDLNLIKNEVGKLKANDSEISSQKAQVEYLLSQNNLDDQRASETAATTLNQVVGGYLHGVSAVTGLNGDDLFKKISDAQADGFDGEELAAITTMLNTKEAEMRLALDQAWTSPLVEGSTNSFSTVLPGKKKEMIDEAMIPFMTIKQMVIDGDVGMAGYYTRINSVNMDKEKSRVLNASPDLRQATALKDLVSPTLAENFLNQDGKQLGVFRDIAPEVSARIVTGGDTMNGAVDRVINSPSTSADKVGFINATIDNLSNAVLSGEASPGEVSNAVKSLYALDSEGKDIFSYVQPNEYMRLYNRMFNPQMTQAITTYGSREDLQNYFTAAEQRIYAIPELKKAAGGLNDTQSNWKNYFEVQFNEGTGRLEMNVKQGGVPLVDIMGEHGGKSGILGAMDYSLSKKLAEESINILNIAFDNLGQIGEAMGADKSMKPAMYAQVLRRLNVDLEQGQKDGFFKRLTDFIGEFIKSDESATNDFQSIDFGLADNAVNTDTTSMGSYFDTIRSVESGGNDNAANPNSSATGRYQIIDSTYNSYARRLGLTGNKNDPANQEAVVKALTRDNANTLSAYGINLSNANLYAAHFLGSEDAVDVLTASDDTPLSALISPRSIKANKFLTGMSVSDFKRWLSTKMN